jgi:hypothetical protein
MGNRKWESDEVTDETTRSSGPSVSLDREETVTAVAADESEETKLRRELAEYTAAFYDIQTEESTQAGNERQRLRNLMRKTQRVLDEMEEEVEIDLPRQPTGALYHCGKRTFLPGRHRVKKGVAQMLLYSSAKAQEAELNLLKQNGRTIDVTPIGQRARNAAIMADN